VVISVETAENLVNVAVAAAGGARERLADALDALPAPIYITDTDGKVTHFNRACIDLAGRVPQIGSDRWCVTWKLLTVDGEPLPA
jgi:PAS domain-containing protein